MAELASSTTIITKKAPEFLVEVLLPDLRRMVYDHKLQYLAFEVIAVGIELLGAFDDPEDFEKSELSESRFDSGMKRMSQTNPRYQKYRDRGSHLYLYKQLRCGIAHIMRPQKKLLLSQRDCCPKGSHLTEVEGHLNLVCEDLYDDFAQSCREMSRVYSTRDEPKFQAPFWNVLGFRGGDVAVAHLTSTAAVAQNFWPGVFKTNDQT